MGLEVSFISVEHAVEPWQKLLGAVVSVENYWDAVRGSNATNVLGTRNSTSDGSGLVGIAQTLKQCQQPRNKSQEMVHPPCRRSKQHLPATSGG